MYSLLMDIYLNNWFKKVLLLLDKLSTVSLKIFKASLDISVSLLLCLLFRSTI